MVGWAVTSNYAVSNKIAGAFIVISEAICTDIRRDCHSFIFIYHDDGGSKRVTIFSPRKIFGCTQSSSFQLFNPRFYFHFLERKNLIDILDASFAE